jgi:RNA polymerase sigma-70 factor (ECF subfamily)
MEKDDKWLILKYIEGDEGSLSFLVDKYLKDLYNFTFRITHSEQMTEDITQLSFIKAWKNIRKFNSDKSSFKTWLFYIARNTAIDFLRQKKDITFSSFEDELGQNLFIESIIDKTLSPNELAIKAEDDKYIEDLLLKLNPDYRDVLKLRYTSNMTFKDISKILKKPLHTIKSQHRRALIALRKIFSTKAI